MADDISKKVLIEVDLAADDNVSLRNHLGIKITNK